MFEKFDKNGLATLAKDLYNGVAVNFNEVSGDDALRNMIADTLGVEAGSPVNYYNWEAKKLEVFQILAVAIDAVLPLRLEKQFDSIADFRQVALGDAQKFEIEDNSLLRIGLVSAGNQSLQRQQLFGRSFTVPTDWYGGKVYAEFERFMSGRVNWKGLVDRVSASFENKIQTEIYNGFSKSYDGLRATRQATGTYEEDKLFDVAEHIGVASGGKPVAVYGTRKALRKITKDLDASDSMKEERNKVGYIDTVGGLDLIALPQAYKSGTEKFAIDDDTLLILPQGEKIVAVVLEGEAIVNDTDPLARTDLQNEFVTLKKLGVQVGQLSIYGMYKITK